MACKHTQEQALDKATITIRPKLELKYKILRLMGNKLSPAKAVEQICIQATQGIDLTEDDEKAIQADMKLARDKRMANRIKVAAFNKGLSDGRFRKDY